MHCRILLQVFLCMCFLFMLADAWWFRSGSSRSSSRSSTSNTRSSTTRRTSTNRGWFWGNRTPRKVTSPPVRTNPTVKPTIKPTTKKRTWWRRGRKTPKPQIPTIPTPITTTKKSKWWNWGRRTFKNRTPTTPATTPAAAKVIKNIFEKAEGYNKVKSTIWKKDAPWRGMSSYKGSWKCNLFVHDLLKEAGAIPPTKNKIQIRANDWADPNSESVTKTGYYEKVPYKERQKGDIIAFKRDGGQSGHVGIVSSKDNFISALRNNVGELNIKNFRENSKDKITGTTIWRYTGPLKG